MFLTSRELVLFITLLSSVRGNGDSDRDPDAEDGIEEKEGRKIPVINVNEGDPLVIECDVPLEVRLRKVRWFKKNDKLQDDGDRPSRNLIGNVTSSGVQHIEKAWSDRTISIILKEDDGTSSTLTIGNVRYPTDSGEYQCVVVYRDVENKRMTHVTKYDVTVSESKLGKSALAGIVCGVVAGAIVVTIIVVIVLGRMGKMPQWCRKLQFGKSPTTKHGVKKDDLHTNATYEDMQNVYDDADRQYSDLQNTNNVVYDHADTHYSDVNVEVYSLATKIDEPGGGYYLLDENDTKSIKVDSTTSPPEKPPVDSYDHLVFGGNPMISDKIAVDSGASYSILGNCNKEAPAYSLAGQLDDPTGA